MYFILFQDVQKQWRWNLNSANHKIIATGAEGYINKADAIHGINLVRGSAASSGIYDKSTEKWM